MVSSYPGARNREEASLEDQHRGEHRRFCDKATPRSMLRNTKDNDGTTTSDRAEESQTNNNRREDEDRPCQTIQEINLTKAKH